MFKQTLPDIQIEKVDESKLYEGQEDEGEADDDEHIQGSSVGHFRLGLLSETWQSVCVCVCVWESESVCVRERFRNEFLSTSRALN